MHNNRVPYCLLTPEEKAELAANKDSLELYNPVTGCWAIVSRGDNFFSYLDKNSIYRINTIPMKVPWSVLTENWRWAAKNKCGIVSFFEAKPQINNSYSNWQANTGATFSTYKYLKCDPGNINWKESLQERPNEM